ncbi:MAG: GAF domain-containing protein [Acidobacteria bacterium]|nr:GAF domain-containing protein [Acidobacteriota bacterium]
MNAPNPFQEAQRLNSLRDYSVLDTPREDDFDQVCRLASELLHVPVACISLVERDRVWFKASVGLTLSEVPREDSFCGRAIELGDFIEVPDAQQDPRFNALAVVVNPPNFRFYAGANLITAEGMVLGTLAVLDTKPRSLGPIQREALRTLAWQVMSLLELRKQKRELSEALAEAGRQREQRSQLLAMISHEVRNSVAAVLGYAELLVETAPDTETKHLSDRVRKAGRQSLDLLNGILDFGRLDSERMPLNLTPIELSAFIGEVLEAFRPAANEKGLELGFINHWEGAPALLLDEVRVRQVLLNLMGNALKFTTSGRIQILARAMKAGDFLRLEVVDSGVGIRNGELLFKPYSQGVRQREGSGLGLYICKQLVELMGGRIGLESELGRGSCFWFTLPAREASLEAQGA